MISLTPRQQQVLDLIKQYTDETGYPPTRAEIARILGFKSPNAAEEHIKALARKGAIEIIPGASRGIRLIPQESDIPDGLPIIGRVAAGNPILAHAHIDDYCNIPPHFFSPSADFLLRVKGMSMKDIGILDGDLLAVHKTEQASNGQVIVARIGEEVTVKRYKRTKNMSIIELWPENSEFDVIRVDLKEQDFAIEGLSVGVIRRES